MGSIGSVGHIIASPSAAQEKTLKEIIRKTSNLKKEQYRIIGEDGTIHVVNKGEEHEVKSTVGDKRKYLDGAVSIHNHPVGGTFSTPDLRDFGYGAKMIVVTAPNGEQYRLINDKWGTPEQSSGWRPLSEAIERDIPKRDSYLADRKAAQEALKNSKEAKAMDKASKQWVKRKAEGASQEELQKYYDEYEKNRLAQKAKVDRKTRSIEVRDFHNYLKKNAKKYGFTYSYKNPI